MAFATKMLSLWFGCLISGIGFNIVVGQDRDDAKKLLMCCYENASTWSTFDCLVEIDKDRFGDTRASSSGTEYFRLVADYGNKRFCFLRGPRVDDASGKDKKSLSDEYSCVVCDGDRVRVLRAPIGVRDYKTSIHEAFSEGGFFDVRLIGVLPFPTSFLPEGMGLSFETRKRALNGGALPAIRTIEFDDSVQLTITGKANGSKSQGVIGSALQSLRISKKTLLPTSYESSVEHNGRYYSQCKYAIEWGELGAAYVPKRMFVEGPKSKMDGSAVLVTIHWFSLNEKIDEARFDVSLLDDIHKVRKLVDPKLSHAESLLPTDQTVSRKK